MFCILEIFKIMHGLPVTVRLLDPPLHEFLPKTDKDIDDIAKELNLNVRKVKNLSDLSNLSILQKLTLNSIGDVILDPLLPLGNLRHLHVNNIGNMNLTV